MKRMTKYEQTTTPKDLTPPYASMPSYITTFQSSPVKICAQRVSVATVMATTGRIAAADPLDGIRLSLGGGLRLKIQKRRKHFPVEVSAEGICLQCFDAVGWAAGRAPGL